MATGDATRGAESLDEPYNHLRVVGDEDNALLFLVVEDMEHLFQHKHLPYVAQGGLIS